MQTTVSRDIHQLGLVKTRAEDGRLVYALPGAADIDLLNALTTALRRWALSIEATATLAVINTPAGYATPLADAIDSAALPDVAGTVAGENTVFAAPEPAVRLETSPSSSATTSKGRYDEHRRRLQRRCVCAGGERHTAISLLPGLGAGPDRRRETQHRVATVSRVGATLRLHRVRERIRPLVPRGLWRHVNRATFAVIALAMIGKRVHCPCCGRSYRRFVDYPSAYCPGCGSRGSAVTSISIGIERSSTATCSTSVRRRAS